MKYFKAHLKSLQLTPLWRSSLFHTNLRHAILQREVKVDSHHESNPGWAASALPLSYDHHQTNFTTLYSGSLSTVVSRKYALPFCNLSLSTNMQGGAFTQNVTFSLAIMPSLPVPHNWVKYDLIVGGGWGPSMVCEASPSIEREAKRCSRC